MDLLSRLALFTPLDFAALGLLVGVWFGVGYLIENTGKSWPSVSYLMADYRRAWMVQMVARDPRIFDAQILTSLRQGTSFFASATMIALGAGLALLGNTEQLIGLANDLAIPKDPEIVWEIKILVILAFLGNAFFKFVWSNRLFGYCAVIMAAVPNDVDDPRAQVRAAKAGEINITAARSFNRGLRAIYFALAGAAWLIGAEALIGATLLVCLILVRREFASHSRKILLGPEPASAP